MEPLRVTLVQQALHWEDRDANLRQFSPLLAPLAGTTDLIVLPEMFTTGFTMAPEGLAEEMDGPSIAWMREHAALIGAALTGSLIIREEGHYYNRLVWMYPNGDMHWYDKRHLFTLAGEHQHYRGGDKRLIAHWKGWRICPLVCYDLRFPHLYRSLARAGAAVIAVPAAFTAATGEAHWHVLLRARAIETGCYMIAPAQTGVHPGGRRTYGHALIVDPWGTVLADAGTGPGVITAALDLDAVERVRARIPSLRHDRDYALPAEAAFSPTIR